MSDRSHISIHLRRTSAGHPAGWVDGAGRRRDFAGWIGLLSVLSELLAASAVPADDLGGESDA